MGWAGRGTVMRIEEMIAAVQAQLGVEVDGKAGPQTWGAVYARIVGRKIDGLRPAEAISPVDDRSEKVIATLLPEVQPMARALVQKAAAVGISIKVISGLRTYAEQDALYAKGRTTPGTIVTNATFQPFTVYGLVALIYFALCWPLSKSSQFLERKLNVAHRNH